MNIWIPSRRRTVILSLIIAGALLCPGWTNHGLAMADQKGEVSVPKENKLATVPIEDAEYHTPLAGEPLHDTVMGHAVDIPARDRGKVTALTLGGEFYFPKQGETSATPIGALYLIRMWPDSRTRNVISIFVNDLEYDKSFGNLELVTRFENNTIPGGQREVVNNREIKTSDTVWGTVVA